MYHSRRSTRSTIVALSLVISSVFAGNDARQSSTRTLPPREQISEPVRVDDVEFQLILPSKWAFSVDADHGAIPISLKITNLTRPLQFNLFDTITVILKNSDGVELAFQKGRFFTIVPAPVTILKGENGHITRDAELKMGERVGTLKLMGSDGAGGSWCYNELRAGKYTIAIKCTNSKEMCDRLKLLLPKSDAPECKPIPFWIGNAITKELSIEISSMEK